MTPDLGDGSGVVPGSWPCAGVTCSESLSPAPIQSTFRMRAPNGSIPSGSRLPFCLTFLSSIKFGITPTGDSPCLPDRSLPKGRQGTESGDEVSDRTRECQRAGLRAWRGRWPSIRRDPKVFCGVGDHGIAHWARVLENGPRLAGETGVDIEVVQLFVILYDSQWVSSRSWRRLT